MSASAWWLGLVLLLVVACSDAISGPPPGLRSVSLAAVADGVSGTAVVTVETTAASTVRVTLRGVTAGVTYAGHVGNGACASPGAVAAPLQAVTAQSTSALSVTGSVPASALTAGHHIQFSKPGPAMVACGNIQ